MSNIFNINKEITEDLVRLSFFTDIGKSIAASRSIKETLNQVMNHIGMIFTPYNWSLLLVNRKTGNLKFVIVVGEAADTLTGVEIQKGKGITGWIADNALPIIIEDVKKDKRFDNSLDKMSGFETKSIIGVPLKTNGKVFGVIELINKLDGTTFTAHDLKILTTIADFAAIAIEKAYYLSSLRKMVNVDPLTGVYNRRFLFFYLDKELKRKKREGAELSLLFIDIDGFKKINDSYGHVEGDKVLISVSKILISSVRDSDMVFRFGGDEFFVLLPHSGRDDACRIIDRINEKIDRLNSGSGIKVTLAIGCSEAEGETAEEVLSKVDSEMYNKKQFKQEENITDLAEHIEEVFLEDEKRE